MLIMLQEKFEEQIDIYFNNIVKKETLLYCTIIYKAQNVQSIQYKIQKL